MSAGEMVVFEGVHRRPLMSGSEQGIIIQAGVCKTALSAFPSGFKTEDLSLRSGLARKSLGEVTNEAIRGACDNDCGYDLTSLAAAFRTFAQRSRCASAIRLRASLLKVRPVLLSFFPPAWPSASNAFPTLPISRSRREYSFCREETTLFRLVMYYPLMSRG
jgi:hypothetical protein